MLRRSIQSRILPYLAIRAVSSAPLLRALTVLPPGILPTRDGRLGRVGVHPASEFSLLDSKHRAPAEASAPLPPLRRPSLTQAVLLIESAATR